MTCPEGVAVPVFDSVEELQHGLAAKRQFSPVDLYPRDGTEFLSGVEARAAHLAHVEPGNLIMFNSGMSAVQAAIEVGLASAEAEKSSDDQVVLAHAYQLYSQTAVLTRSLGRRGIKLVAFDSGSPTAIERMLANHSPDVILTETIGNGPDVPVLDTEHLLSAAAEQANRPTVLLDNTLPLSTASPLGETLSQEENVLVVESGTKSYTLNNELSGFIYSKTPALVKAVLEYRRTTGVMPGLGSLERIDSLLPSSREAFDARNRRLYETTGKLALALFEIQDEASDFIVLHPGLTTHDNYAISAERYGGGATPLFFLQCTGPYDQFCLAERLWSSPEVQRHTDLGQSFGFDRTRLLPDERAPAVRIAGGAYTDVEALGAALQEAALTKN
jgi:cystathionine beta-lyase/cystathionine gamma-synthase